MYSSDALRIANYVIQYAEDHEYGITCFKLNKVLYYICGYYGAVFDKRLFREDFEAWELGPILRSVYIEYCASGPLNIWSRYIDHNYPPAKFSDKERRVIDKVLEDKLKMPGGELVDAIKKEDPWKRHEHEIGKKPHIKFEEMQSYFKQLPDVKQLRAEILKSDEEHDETENCVSSCNSVTNYEWIKSMNVREIANLLCNSPWGCNTCPEGKLLEDNPLMKDDRCSEECVKHCARWLLSEREGK